MFDLIKVSMRNVGRNKRRTLITVITILIGVMVTTGIRSLLNGLQNEIKSGLTRKVYGDLQIHRIGYQDSMESTPYKMLLSYNKELIDKLTANSPVISIAPRLRIMGLLNHQKSQTTTPVILTGIDTNQELSVTPRLLQSVVEGALLDSNKEKSIEPTPHSTQAIDELEEAQGLDSTSNMEKTDKKIPSSASASYHQIMLTPSLMRGFKASIGDEIIILISDKNNMQQALIAKITGVIDYGMPTAGSRMAWIDFKTLQQISGTKGLASELALRTNNDFDIAKAQLAVAKIIPNELVVETYLDLAGLLADAMALQNLIFSIILIIVFTIVIAAIVNTSLMTVMERTREIGALMALGYRRRHILMLFLGEFAIIGILGACLGLFVASCMIAMTHFYGLNFTLPGQNIPVILYPSISLTFVSFVFFLAIFAALIAGLIPAYRASRMKPVEALSSI